MSVFLDRVAAVFGKKAALLLKLAGLTAGEVRGQGAWVFDDNGRRWLDCGSFGLHLLGHCHPEIVAAATDQLTRLGLSTRILGNTVAAACAEELVATLPAPLRQVVFANSGSEAVEIAIKTALYRTGRRAFVVFENAYHGKTTGAWSLSQHAPVLKPCKLGCLEVHVLPVGDPAALRHRLATRTVAGVFIEPIQGEGGMIPVPRDFLEEVGRVCRDTETQLILDEIQTGLGRCGRLWCAVDEDLVPDLLLVGKALGGGVVPIAAMVQGPPGPTKREADPLIHSSSFAGGAFACRIARTVLQIVRAPAFLARIQALGATCFQRLRQRLIGRPAVVDIRGQGMMVGIECASPRISAQALTQLMQRGLLISFCLSRPEVLRFYPPAIISEDDLSWALEQLGDVLAGED